MTRPPSFPKPLPPAADGSFDGPAPIPPDPPGEARAVSVVTFGCRLNTAESEVIKAKAADAGLTDAIIFNTCAVTAEATRQARQAIRRARRERPEARIIVTGCGAQVETDRFAAMAEVDAVIGNAEKLEAGSWNFGTGADERVRVNDIMALRETGAHLIEGFEGRTRAFVQVQNGCDHRCTFCIIPFGRGNSRSVPVGAVVDQVRTLVARGYREVVLTGVDVTSYGPDLPGNPSLGDLAKRILSLVPDLPRLRLSSIDSVEVDPTLLDLIANEPRLMPHLHLSLQSGDDMILKRMKRRHSRAQSVAFVEQVRRLRPDTAFGADLIAGFPTETDEMAENSRRLVEELGIAFLHVFPFSPRPGTPAARMPAVARDVIKERAQMLRETGQRMLDQFLASQIGRRDSMLVEKDGAGRIESFAQIDVPGARAGDIVPVKITGQANGRLAGEMAGNVA